MSGRLIRVGPRHIVYLSYGEGPHVAQIAFSALSAMRFRGRRRSEAVTIVVYADRPEDYDGLGVDCVSFSAEQLRAWRGPYGFNHVVKLEVLRDALGRFGAGCVLVDGDSYFRRDPRILLSRIGAGRTVMHLRECRLDRVPSPSLRELRAGLAGARFTAADGRAFALDRDAELWNAGVIGMAPSDVGLVDEAIHLAHQVYERTRSFISEQLSISYVLSRRTRLRRSDDVVYHYWPYLRHWDPPHGPTEWAARVPRLVADTAEMPPEQRGAALVREAYRLPFWGRHGRLYWHARPLFERLGAFDPDIRRSV